MSHSAGLARSFHEMPAAAYAAGRGLNGARVPLARGRADRLRPAWHKPQAPAPLAPVRQSLQLEEIRFRHLQAAEDIASVLPLRREINLPLAGDPGFAALEKKEMSAALSAHSTGADKPSAPSASFPSATASRRARKSWPVRNCRRSCSPTAGK
jgi:hypothetical protein